MTIAMPLKLSRTLFFIILTAAISAGAAEPPAYAVENASLARTLSVIDGHLRTVKIVNKRSAVGIALTNAMEFRLRLSEGTDHPETAVTLTSSDFQVIATSNENGSTRCAFTLTNSAQGIAVTVTYE